MLAIFGNRYEISPAMSSDIIRNGGIRTRGINEPSLTVASAPNIAINFGGCKVHSKISLFIIYSFLLGLFLALTLYIVLYNCKHNMNDLYLFCKRCDFFRKNFYCAYYTKRAFFLMLFCAFCQIRAIVQNAQKGWGFGRIFVQFAQTGGPWKQSPTNSIFQSPTTPLHSKISLHENLTFSQNSCILFLEKRKNATSGQTGGRLQHNPTNQ